MRVEPYLSFEGRCEEALEFYKKAIGAEVTMLMRFGESPDKSMLSPGSEKKVMHSSVKIGDSVVMATDGRNTGKANFQGISLSITANTDADAKRIFDALSDGGQLQLPLTKTFFASSFGMLSDKFGVNWMVSTPGM
jgi:PhnB protein